MCRKTALSLHTAQRVEQHADAISPMPLRGRGIRRLWGEEAVADAELGQEDARLRGVGLNLLPQLAHEDAQIVGVLQVRRAPDLLEQELVGDHVSLRAAQAAAAAGIPWA